MMADKNKEYREDYHRLTTLDEDSIPVIYTKKENGPVVSIKPILSNVWQVVEVAEAYAIYGTLVDALWDREEKIGEAIRDAIDEIVDWVGGYAKEQEKGGEVCEFSWTEFWEKCRSVKRVCCGGKER